MSFLKFLSISKANRFAKFRHEFTNKCKFSSNGGFLTQNQIEKYRDNGILSIPDFLTSADIDSLKSNCQNYLSKIDFKQLLNNNEWDNSDEFKQHYFLNSWNKIRLFFREDFDLSETDSLAFNLKHSLNKIGHNLHGILPEFRRVAFDPRCKSICQQLGMTQPAICQSMFIFKGAHGGSEVHNHQDLTFLWNEPFTTIIGFWVALDDADEKNGCLSFLPGSHKEKKLINNRRMLRDEATNFESVRLTDKPPQLDLSAFRPIIVRAGSLVLIDGFTVHRSQKNLSDRPRQVFTWHVTDARPDNHWSKLNWIRPEDGMNEFARY